MSTIRLYKFCNAKYAESNLREKRLKVSRLSELNDPFEWNGVILRDAEDREHWRKLRTDLWQDIGLICFSDRWSNPVLWSHYGEQHRGASLGFDVPRQFAKQVSYRSQRLQVPPLRDIVAGKDGEWIRKATYTKFSHWRYETEWRVLMRIDRGHLGEPLVFEPFSEHLKLAEIIIGAYSDLSTSILREHVGPEVPIRTARLAFRSFKVVEQRNRSLRR